MNNLPKLKTPTKKANGARNTSEPSTPFTPMRKRLPTHITTFTYVHCFMHAFSVHNVHMGDESLRAPQARICLDGRSHSRRRTHGIRNGAKASRAAAFSLA